MIPRKAGDYLFLVQRDADCLRLLAQAARSEYPGRDVSDWIVTIHFYILCVYVKALGSCRQQNFQDHYAIRQWLNTEPDLLGIARPYRKVEEASRDARYEGRLFAPPEIQRFHQWFQEARDQFVALLRKEGVTQIPNPDPVVP